MKKHFRLIKRKAYRTMFLNILLLTSIVIMIISTVLFVLFAQSSVKEVGMMSKSMLQQTSYAADIVENQVQTVGNQLINDHTVMNAMFNPHVDRVEEYGVVNLLNRLQAVYTFIDYIGIYNKVTDRYMNTKGLSAEDERSLLGHIDEWTGSHVTRLFPRSVKNVVGHSNMELLTFVQTPGSIPFFPKKGAIVVNMKQSYITNLLQGLKNKSSNFLIVTDANGLILSRTDSGQFLQDASGQPYMSQILHSANGSGSFVTRVDGEKNLVSYVKSEELDWYFVSVNRYDEILSNLSYLRRVVFIIAGAMLIVSMLTIYWLTNQMYDPLDKLIRKINGSNRLFLRGMPSLNEFMILDEAFHSMTEKTRRLEPALFAAHKGQLLQYIKGSSAELLPSLPERLAGPKFRVILIKFDAYTTFKAVHDDRMQAVIRFAVCNISEELTGLESVIAEADEIALLEQRMEEEAPDWSEQLRQIQATLSGYFKLSVSISIGETVTSAIDISDSYQGARKAMRRRFIEGRGGIFHSIAASCGDTLPISDGERDAIRDEIVQAVGRASQDLEAAVERAIGAVRGQTYEQALMMMNQLLNDLFQHFGKVPLMRDEAFAFIDLAYSLSTCETMEEVARRILEIGGSIANLLERRTIDRHESIVNELKQLVGRDYSNPNLSLDAISERFQLTSGYLGKMFKGATGVSFNDYLKETRLEKAREMLLGTKYTAADISERVGVYNSTYFYTLFKKKFGVSPAQYRTDSLRQLKAGDSEP